MDIGISANITELTDITNIGDIHEYAVLSDMLNSAYSPIGVVVRIDALASILTQHQVLRQPMFTVGTVSHYMQYSTSSVTP